jgi:L-amino acid N-acyltransferase YncA
MEIRPATEADVGAMLAIYSPIVRATAISFELTPPSLEEFKERIRKASDRWACYVAEEGSAVLGYAYRSSHRDREAYRWSTETTAYVAAEARGRGVGKALYDELLPALAARGYCNAYAGVAIPNDASVALHQRVGFQLVGTFPAVGRKFGQWRDVAWFHRQLRQLPPSEA